MYLSYNYNNEEENLRLDSKVHCKGAHFLHSALSWSKLNPTELAYNPCWLESGLKLTASDFDQLKPVCPQSWWQGLLLRRTRRFFPSSDQNHRQYSLHLYMKGWPG